MSSTRVRARIWKKQKLECSALSMETGIDGIPYHQGNENPTTGIPRNNPFSIMPLCNGIIVIRITQGALLLACVIMSLLFHKLNRGRMARHPVSM